MCDKFSSNIQKKITHSENAQKMRCGANQRHCTTGTLCEMNVKF